MYDRIQLQLRLLHHDFLDVALRVLRLPLPRVSAHVIDTQLRMPFQHILRQRGIGIHFRHIARPSWGDRVRHILPGGLAHARHQFQHRHAMARAQVHGLASNLRGVQLLQCRHVTAGQIHDVNVIADASPVGCIVIIAKHAEPLTTPHGHLRDERHEVVGNALRILPDASRRMRADGIEVPQNQHVPALVRGMHVAQNLFDEQLRAAVRIRGRQSGAFQDGQHLGFAVDGRARGEDEAADVAVLQFLKQIHGAADVAVVVRKRFRHGFADGLEAGEVDAGIDVGEFFEDFP
mmetsp:Transcript_6147/g.16730  ORF Transcript_6147/g.16730 Transcript_6147/m.16730 type:complete len:291 (-) Transcript_6147:10-882(-)